MPFRPKHLRQFSEAELEALERLNLNGPDSPGSPLRNSIPVDGHLAPSKINMETNPASMTAKKIDIDLLEKKAVADQEVNGHLNGHA